MSRVRKAPTDPTDYVVDVLLIAVIFRQLRPRELTTRSAVLPLVLVA
jgi:hypothetical protein